MFVFLNLIVVEVVSSVLKATLNSPLFLKHLRKIIFSGRSKFITEVQIYCSGG